MLSRVANNLYWMSRYIERAENLARLVDVNRYDALDGSFHSESGLDESDAFWQPLLSVTCIEEAYAEEQEKSEQEIDVSWFVTFSDSSGNSIRDCIAQARENARMVRDQISEEMWLELNSFHLFMQSEKSEALWSSQPGDFYRSTIKFCLLFAGLIDSTIRQDEAWQFVQLGKFLERADKVTRVLDMLAYQGDPSRLKLASALRSCSAFSAFRSEYRGEITLENVMGFLFFSASFPRSVRLCLRHIDDYLHSISGSQIGTYSNEAERVAGHTLAQLNFSSIDDVLAVGFHEYIDRMQQRFNQIGEHIFEAYILPPVAVPEPAHVSDQPTERKQQQQQQQQQQQ
jgi:uncharacterized alpha-E superfamily protein